MYYVDKKVSSGTQPQELEITPTAVYVRKDIQEVAGEVEGEKLTHYLYSESKYSKDDFIESVTKKNKEMADEVAMMGGAVVELVSLVMGGMR